MVICKIGYKMTKQTKKETSMLEWKKSHWEMLISIVLVIGTILGVTIPLHIQNKTDMAAQAARTDRLYEMFIDLLKQSKSY